MLYRNSQVKKINQTTFISNACHDKYAFLFVTSFEIVASVIDAKNKIGTNLTHLTTPTYTHLIARGTYVGLIATEVCKWVKIVC